MKLIIVRHGEAETAINDFNRNLTSQGQADITKLTALIRATGWNIVEILTSPLVRTRQTADIIARELGSPISPTEEKALAPGVDMDEILGLLDREANSDAAIWAFHAPDVSRVAALFTGVPESHLYCPPGTMIALNLPLPAPEGRGMLVWKMQPEYFRAV